ncbi:MAG: hypothetical protein ACKO7C_06240, partial [Bacteroidota bacterium]
MKYLKGLLLAAGVAVVLVSCEEKKTPKTSRSVELTGDFEDTLWNANAGTIYSLTLYSDSSFYLRTRVIGGDSKTFLGKYKPNEAWDGLTLKCA